MLGEKTIMLRASILSLLCASICLLGTGCYSAKPIPAAYFEQECEVSVKMGRCPEKAQMTDSGQGGLIGAIVTAGRATKMQEAMEGITGDTVKELVRQRFEAAIEDYFDVYEDGQLKTVIEIERWGWFVPTTIAGIKTGAYQFTLGGRVRITDTQISKKGTIAFYQASVSHSIGDLPTAAVSQEALLQCAENFAAETVAFLAKEHTADSK